MKPSIPLANLALEVNLLILLGLAFNVIFVKSSSPSSMVDQSLHMGP